MNLNDATVSRGIEDRIRADGGSKTGESAVRRASIANRDEIALRAVRACAQLWLDSVTAYSPAGGRLK